MNQSYDSLYFLPGNLPTLNAGTQFSHSNTQPFAFVILPNHSLSFNSHMLTPTLVPEMPQYCSTQHPSTVFQSFQEPASKKEVPEPSPEHPTSDRKSKTSQVQEKPKKILKRKYAQNPKRNVITNIGNHLLCTFSNQTKLQMLLVKMGRQIDSQLIQSLFIEIGEIRKRVNSYLNLKKMKEMWFESKDDAYHQQTKSLFRALSYFYLSNYYHLLVLKSLKMNKEAQQHHLNGIRELVGVLRHTRFSYRYA